MSTLLKAIGNPAKAWRHITPLFTVWHWKRQLIRTLPNIPVVRTVHNTLYTKMRPFKYSASVSSQYRAIGDKLNQDGFFVIENFLDHEKVDRINRELEVCKTRSFADTWEYYEGIASQCPTIAELLTSEFFIDISSLYINAHSRLISYNAWETKLPSSGTSLADVYHSDRGDFKWLNFFIYLVDVDMEGGPHVYVKGSHKKRPKECGRWWSATGHRIGGDRLMQYFQPDDFQYFCFPKGSLIIEDTWGVHKGLTPVSKPRRMLEVIYGMHPHSHTNIWRSDLGKCPQNYFKNLSKKQQRSIDFVLDGQFRCKP